MIARFKIPVIVFLVSTLTAFIMSYGHRSIINGIFRDAAKRKVPLAVTYDKNRWFSDLRLHSFEGKEVILFQNNPSPLLAGHIFEIFFMDDGSLYYWTSIGAYSNDMSQLWKIDFPDFRSQYVASAPKLDSSENLMWSFSDKSEFFCRRDKNELVIENMIDGFERRLPFDVDQLGINETEVYTAAVVKVSRDGSLVYMLTNNLLKPEKTLVFNDVNGQWQETSNKVYLFGSMSFDGLITGSCGRSATTNQLSVDFFEFGSDQYIYSLGHDQNRTNMIRGSKSDVYKNWAVLYIQEQTVGSFIRYLDINDGWKSYDVPVTSSGFMLTSGDLAIFEPAVDDWE